MVTWPTADTFFHIAVNDRTSYNPEKVSYAAAQQCTLLTEHRCRTITCSSDQLHPKFTATVGMFAGRVPP